MIIWVLLTLGCSESTVQEYENWRKSRLDNLLKPYGWPSVVGLYPLEAGTIFFGSQTDDGIVMENVNDTLGFLTITENDVTMTVGNGESAIVEGKAVDYTTLHSDISPNGPTVVNYRSLQWYVIKRDEERFLRLKDTFSLYREKLRELPIFPYDDSNIVVAKVNNTALPETVSYKNVLGHTIVNEVAAYLDFKWKQDSARLIALPNDEETFFIILGDASNGISTYGGGRFLYPKKADENGNVVLDFNKLINPPCVFTPYATCPLPPRQNRLPFEILAGEKDLHLY